MQFSIYFFIFSQAIPISLDDLKARIIDSRSSLQHGELVITSNTKERSEPKEEFEYTNYTWKIFLSREKVRGDYLASRGRLANIRQLASVNGENPGWAFAQTEIRNTAAYFGPIGKVPGGVGKWGMLLFAADFRPIGMLDAPVKRSISSGLGHIFQRYPVEKGQFTILEERRVGEKSIRFTGNCQKGPSSTLSFTVLPDQGWSLVEIKTKINETDGVTEGISHIQNQQVNGIWFPKSIKFQRFFERELICEETAEIEIKSLNQPLPDELFTRKGLNLKDNTFISTPNGVEVFINGAFIPYSAYIGDEKPREPQALETPTSTKTSIYLIGGGFFAIVSLALFFFYGKK